jgi:RNA polymerase sigma-70 factor (ECF subfamily)
MTQPAHLIAVQPLDAAVGAAGSVRALLDERAFLELYARTAVALRAYIVRTLGNPTDADDLVQEAYLRLLRTPVPVGDAQALRAYLFRTASNLVVDRHRARKHEAAEAVPERASHDPDAALKLDVGRLLGRLKPRERQLIWLAHVEGADHTEIASMLGLRYGSVRVLLARARSRLARLLRDGHSATAGER